MKTKTRNAVPRSTRRFSSLAFFDRWPVFTLGAFRAEHAKTGVKAASTTLLLRSYVEVGRLVHLRRGLFALAGAVDPYQVASLLAPDAVLAYDGALSFHGLALAGDRISFLSFGRCRTFVLDEIAYQAVRPARSLKPRRALVDGVETRKVGGRALKVTSRERTLVDGLDRPDLVPSLWALVKAFLEAGQLDVGELVGHAEALAHSLTAARLGHVLETLRWGTQAQLRRLEALAPRSPVYFDTPTRSEPSHFEGRWHLVVPNWLPNCLTMQITFGPDGPPSRSS